MRSTRRGITRRASSASHAVRSFHQSPSQLLEELREESVSANASYSPPGNIWSHQRFIHLCEPDQFLVNRISATEKAERVDALKELEIVPIDTYDARA